MNSPITRKSFFGKTASLTAALGGLFSLAAGGYFRMSPSRGGGAGPRVSTDPRAVSRSGRKA